MNRITTVSLDDETREKLEAIAHVSCQTRSGVIRGLILAAWDGIALGSPGTRESRVIEKEEPSRIYS